MAPPDVVSRVNDLLISNTEHGVQTGKSLLESYISFDQYLTKIIF